MKYFNLSLILFLCHSLFGQIQQNINKTSSVTPNLISDIDSIRFVGTPSKMEIIFKDGQVESNNVSDIKKVTFSDNSIPTYPAGSVFCASGPTEIIDKTNPITGRIWMDRNLGASRAAISSTDSLAYGDLYQWGRNSDGHQCRNSQIISTFSSTDKPSNNKFIIITSLPYDWRSPQNNNLWQDISGENNPCPSGYRLPTNTELNEEITSWKNAGGYNAKGAFTFLKLPMAGGRSSINGTVKDEGLKGFYWSSTVSSSGSDFLLFTSSGAIVQREGGRSSGGSVRCIKDNKIGLIDSIDCGSAVNLGTLKENTLAGGVNSWVKYWGGNGAPYRTQTVNSTGVKGLTAILTEGTFVIKDYPLNLLFNITGTPTSSGTASFTLTIGGQTCTITREVQASIISQYPAGSVFCASGATPVFDVINPKTGRTWMDRNLGARRDATSFIDSLAYGDLYQWGRKSDGHQCRNSLTTTNLSATDETSHGDFILAANSPFDWRNPQNTELWQGVNGVNNPCPIGYRLPTDIELNAELTSWSSKDAKGAFASPLKLSMAGFRGVSNGIVIISSAGNVGNYWSSTVNSDKSQKLFFNSSSANMYNTSRWGGASVRCIKD